MAIATVLEDDRRDDESNTETRQKCPIALLEKCLRKTDDASAFAFVRNKYSSLTGVFFR